MGGFNVQGHNRTQPRINSENDIKLFNGIPKWMIGNHIKKNSDTLINIYINT